jgi:hypothetical protein
MIMMIKRPLLLLTLSLCTLMLQAQVALDSVGRKADYIQTITGRSQKIVDQLGLTDATIQQNVRNIIANRYFKLSDISEKFPNGDAQMAELYRHHFELEADLSMYLNADQIDKVKDGLTYGVVPKTYQAHLEMIPSLKPEEKAQILAWLKEAREFAMDAGTSKDKHAWFGKYKGRINNWLAKRGYNLTKEREEWAKRIESSKKK